MPESRVVTDVQILAEADKREERFQLAFKANLADESVHGDRAPRAFGSARYSDPTKVELVFEGIGSLNQRGGIHVEVFAAMEVTQETDAAEEIADEVFKC